MSNKFIDLDTGEILSKREITKKTKEHSVDRYVGVETKFPSDAKTKEQLIEAVSVLDPFLDKKVKVNYSALLQSVTEGILTVKESSIIAFMSENVTAWNYYIGRVCDLEHIISDPKNLNRALKGLETKGLIKINHKGFFYKDSVVINISPFYAWKGDMSVRGSQVDKWYSGSSLIA